MSITGLLDDLRAAPGYRDQIVHTRVQPERPARFADPARPLTAAQRACLDGKGIERLWTHQARALDLAREGGNVLMTTGPASGKSLGYLLPLLEILEHDPDRRALLLFPTKALSRDQLRSIGDLLPAGVYDGDTPAAERRRHRDRARGILTNPDMLHAALLPQHPRWSNFLGRLDLLVIDEMHVYDGIFGANVANLLRRLYRVCDHYGANPQTVACSATIGNPGELAERLTGRPFTLVDEDGSPRGRRTFVFWNPPTERPTRRRSRRSANVEAHDLAAAFVRRGVRTITFSKARVTAELIHRYVRDELARSDPHLAAKVAPYRGGYLPEERRELERRLFSGELLAVSSTNALELGIDVGGLDAAVIVGWPGTIASFLQQGGRAGRRDRESLVVLVGLETATNQYVLRHPEYVFDRTVEEAAIEPENPFVLTGHLRCAAQELPLSDTEASRFGPDADVVLEVLDENRKVSRVGDLWYHAASETPQHEVGLRDGTDRNILIEDVDSGGVIGEVGKWDAQSVLHPEAIYLHRGETYRVINLDLEKSVATVKRVAADYYTQSKGGDDVHHVDRILREKRFGTGTAFFGEVTAHFRVYAYEKVKFYGLDAISRHRLSDSGVDLPTWPVETMSFWIEPPEDLLADLAKDGLDPASGLRGIGFATRMVLPFFVRSLVLDLSHSVGSANTPWQTVFLWEHFPRGLGYTANGFRRLHEIVPAVRRAIRECPCARGCPLCVGKPLHDYTVLNPERGEGSIPSKAAALRILDGLLGDESHLDEQEREVTVESKEALRIRLARSLRRRLEHEREPDVLRPWEPIAPKGYPDREDERTLDVPDAAVRGERRRDLKRRLNRLGSKGGRT